jgi:hypothetical protein
LAKSYQRFNDAEQVEGSWNNKELAHESFCGKQSTQGPLLEPAFLDLIFPDNHNDDDPPKVEVVFLESTPIRTLAWVILPGPKLPYFSSSDHAQKKFHQMGPLCGAVEQL